MKIRILILLGFLAFTFLFSPLAILAEEQVDLNPTNCYGHMGNFNGNNGLREEIVKNLDFLGRTNSQGRPNAPYFTMEAWIKPIATDQYDKYIDSWVIARQSDGSDSVLEFGIKDSRLTARLYTISGVRFVGLGEVSGRNIILANTKWYHIAFVRRGKFIQLYLDGEADSAATEIKDSGLGNTTFSGALAIGGQVVDSSHLSLWKNFKGYIDEVRISNIAVYTNDFYPPTAPFMPDAHTLALWHMDEAPDSQIAHDSALITTDENEKNHLEVVNAERMFEPSTMICGRVQTIGNVIPRINTFRIPQAQKKHPLFNFKFTATDANTKDKLNLTAQDLPDNLALVCPKKNVPGRIDCTLEGIPQSVGTFYFTLTATDDKGGTSSKNFILRVNP